MVPHRGLVHPWLAEPVWVPENPALLGDNNLLSLPSAMNEYDDTTRDRYRDRVPFGHEVSCITIHDTQLLAAAIAFQTVDSIYFLFYPLTGCGERYPPTRLCDAISSRQISIRK
jgi:hypothetical protein